MYSTGLRGFGVYGLGFIGGYCNDSGVYSKGFGVYGLGFIGGYCNDSGVHSKGLGGLGV